MAHKSKPERKRIEEKRNKFIKTVKSEYPKETAKAMIKHRRSSGTVKAKSKLHKASHDYYEGNVKKK